LVTTGLIAAGVGLGALIPAGARPAPSREIVVVARDMQFFLEGGDEPNPRIVLRAGENVRLVLRNEDTGLTHDLVVDAIGAAVPSIKGRGVASVTLSVPPVPGTYEYICTPHARMMRGVLDVTVP
jgi:plastocyanin